MRMDYKTVRLKEKSDYIGIAAKWFADKWSVPEEEYRKSMMSSVESGKPVPSCFPRLSEKSYRCERRVLLSAII